MILQESPLPIKFYGFVEGDDIAAGTVDVVVTDGFTGNIALKATEGTVRLFGHFIKQALSSSIAARMGAVLAGPALNALKFRVDPRRYNGAMFLGLNGICSKSHGGTDAGLAVDWHDPVGNASNRKYRRLLGHDNRREGIDAEHSQVADRESSPTDV